MSAESTFNEWPKPERKGQKLTQEAEDEYELWCNEVQEHDGCHCYGDRGPCSVCEHEGHPAFLQDQETAWEPAVDFLALNKEFSSQ